MKKLHFAARSLLVGLVLVSVLYVSACSKQTQPTTSTPTNSFTNPTTAPATVNYLPMLQKNGFFKARFFALMNFSFSGTTVTYATELTTASVPINWMATIFDGKLEETGAGEDVTDQIHGSISTDGQWVTDMFFSRSIVNSGNNTGIFYRITLHNVPLAGLDTTQILGSAILDKEGDIQKYVTKVEYQSGPVVNGQISPTTTYLSTDWKNLQTGMIPILRFTFEIQPSNILGPTPLQPGMGMGR